MSSPYEGMTQERLNELWRKGCYAVCDYYHWLFEHLDESNVDDVMRGVPWDLEGDLWNLVKENCARLDPDSDLSRVSFLIADWFRRTFDRSEGIFAKCRLCGWSGHLGDTTEPHLSYHRCPVCKGRDLDVEAEDLT